MRPWMLLALTAFPVLMAEKLQFSTVSDPVVLGRLQRIARGSNESRYETLRTLFQEAGCPAPGLQEEKAKGPKLPNLVCTLPGESDTDIILVTAHFDKVRAGAGAIDNWSGASLLPSLFQGLSHSHLRRHRFLFVGFTDEEAGLVGSRAWVSAHKKTDLNQVRAVVNIDSVAAGPLPFYIWASRSDKELAVAALRLAETLKIPLEGMNADKVGDSDTTPFRNHKIPVIDFHSLKNKTFPLLYTIDDQLSAVNVDAHKATYRFLAVYLTYIDTLLAKKTPAGSPSSALN